MVAVVTEALKIRINLHHLLVLTKFILLLEVIQQLCA